MTSRVHGGIAASMWRHNCCWSLAWVPMFLDVLGGSCRSWCGHTITFRLTPVTNSAGEPLFSARFCTT